ncbi:flagellar biosynthesis protein FlhB [Aeoliella sp. ICT_H6.2]|uniref:Flagellar biosynthetic protein FlhB n=1 Tax=Aeoliella straminimaris TaxID=2954799 RepID=A0A9X2FJK7_9BACT|nr:flagellar biosynthesis protein FlhB [Aeoliella straminimaris]MCO6047341.1 flagellar biosynthesis protein FlhB [Aeoliella straminimaris]
MPEQSGEKSFDATPHRRQQARDKGQVAYSQDLGSAAILLVAAGLLKGFGPGIVNAAAELINRNVGEVGTLTGDRAILTGEVEKVLSGAGFALLPLMVLLMMAAAASSVFQVGFLFVPERLVPDFSRISPVAGIKRIVSLQGVMRLGFGLLKVLLVVSVAGIAIWLRRDEIMFAGALTVSQISMLLVEVTVSTLLWVGGALLVLALFDFAFQKWKHEQDLKMTHQEVKEEMKNMQGDPQIIARRRQVQRQMVMNRMSGAVPQADVVITNPTELAVAIKYEHGQMAAPVVVAKGAGVLAQRIRRLALENNIPIVERKPLAQLLYKEVEINHPVPDGSYAAVAEVLAYVYQLKGKKVPGANRRAA